MDTCFKKIGTIILDHRHKKGIQKRKITRKWKVQLLEILDSFFRTKKKEKLFRNKYTCYWRRLLSDISLAGLQKYEVHYNVNSKDDDTFGYFLPTRYKRFQFLFEFRFLPFSSPLDSVTLIKFENIIVRY